MEALTFQGDAFSEYYLTTLVWQEPKLKALLGTETAASAYRKSASTILRAQRALRARERARSTQTLLLGPLSEVFGWTLGEEGTIETAEGSEDAGSPLFVDGERPLARVRALAPEAPLDLPETGIHRRFAPSLSMVRVLEEMKLSWGILLNAFELRVILRAEGFISSHLAFDLTAIAEGGRAGFDAWKLMWALLRKDALETVPPLLEQVLTLGREHQEKVGEGLGRQVQEAIVAFIQGVMNHPANRDRIPRPVPPDFLQRLYAESLRSLYRILFALYAESRGLLPVDLATYREGYSIARLVRRATSPETDPRRKPGYSGRFFELSLRALFDLLRVGADLGPEGRIPMYDGALFDHSLTELIESLVWGDGTVAEVLDKLTRVPGRAEGLVRLSYRELDVEQLGAIYETLLERTLELAQEPMWRIRLDARELVVTASERSRLAERRGERLEDQSLAIEESREEPPEEGEFSDDDEPESDEEDEEQENEEAPPPRSRKPSRVVAEVPAGSVYLKAGMRRKQTGSFYTNRAFVEFLVCEAIDPLAVGKSPEEILSLKIVDLAMGSAHFLVGACRRLAEHLLSAYRRRYEEVIERHGEMSPGDVFIEAGIHPEVARNWEHEEQALAACRLLIAGNCLYGVDKNPLAVDLARVSLWLATAAVHHPLTFLDHRLRVGDSLLGMPLYLGDGDEPEVHLLKPEMPQGERRGRSRKRQQEETPMFAGVNMVEVVTATTRRLRERIRRALGHLDLISKLENDSPGDFRGQRAAFNSMQSELQMFWELHRLRIGKEFLTPENQPRVSEAINRWLAEVAERDRPTDETRGLAESARARGEESGAFCWQLAFPEVFFGADGQLLENPGFDGVIGNPPWDKIKPNERECFGEFDPTVWDLQGQDRKRLIAQLRRENPEADAAWIRHESETKAMSAALLHGGLYHHQIAEVEGKKTGGDPDSFKFFAERAYQLLRNGGRAGIIVPLGLQVSLGCTGLRRLLLDSCLLSVLCKLDNERLIFRGVFHGQKFDLIVFEKGGRTDEIEAAFFSWEAADVLSRFRSDPRYLRIKADLYRQLAPEQYVLAELRDQRDVELLRRIYEQFPRLGEKLEDTWDVSFVREFDMTNDSYLFRDAARLKEMGATLHGRYPPVTETAKGAPFVQEEGGEYWTTPEEGWYESQSQRFSRTERWVDSGGRVHLPKGIPEKKAKHRLTGYVLKDESDDASALPIKPDETYVPLYEGRMVHQFDHCQKGYVSGSGRRAKWSDLTWSRKEIVPHFFVCRRDVEGLNPSSSKDRPGVCLVTGPTNERTSLAGLIPVGMACGHSLATAALSPQNVQADFLLIAVLNSFVVDWVFRLVVSNNIGFYHLHALPFPRNLSSGDVLDRVDMASSRLCLLTPEVRESWRLMSELFPDEFSTPWTPQQASLDPCDRAEIRAGIDALVARLYGLSSYDYGRVLSTFPLLDRDQPPLPGDVFLRMTNKGEKVLPRSYITRDLALLAFFELEGKELPSDIVAFFKEAGIDIERQTGPIRDLRTRVEEATLRGAVAYVPTASKRYNPEGPYLPPDLPEELRRDWNGSLKNWVVEDPEICGGQPTFAGTRIAVEMISSLLSKGWTFSEVIESYPSLQKEHLAIAFLWSYRA